jgi:glutamyl-tRNA reductase
VKITAIGCSFRSADVELRERLAFSEAMQRHALAEFSARYGCEAVLLSTCNRVELYTGRPTGDAPPPDRDLVAEFLAETHKLPAASLSPHLYAHADADAVQHLFRVVASLDSMIVGEGQIAGQVKRAYELAASLRTAGPLLHALFQHARRVAKRVRTETGISRGNVSVSSVAVEYVRQVFDHFHDKTVLVIGAGKMGELTLRHLKGLAPQRILVTNRSPEKAASVADGCGGAAVPWEQLDDALARADIVLSTTGAAEPVVTAARWGRVLTRRAGRQAVVLDIAVPRDFDPAIHDGDRTCLFNIDDLKRIRDKTIAERLSHLAPAEAIIEQERRKFVQEWIRQRNGPLIAQLTQDFDAKREAVVAELLARLDGKLSDDDRKMVEGAFRRLQNQILRGPIVALQEASHEGGSNTLRDTLKWLFRLQG